MSNNSERKKAGSTTTTLETLAEKWRSDAQSLEHYGATNQASVLRRCASDLELALEADSRTLLSLEEAARISGYSPGHLGRLIRKGSLPREQRTTRRVEQARFPCPMGSQMSYEPHAADAQRDRDTYSPPPRIPTVPWTGTCLISGYAVQKRSPASPSLKEAFGTHIAGNGRPSAKGGR